MKYYLIAGEASGDLHASHLMQSLKDIDASAKFRFFGGDLMAAVGGTRVRHYRELAYMGFIPVLLHLRTILRNMKMCKEDIQGWQPDCVILVDYPGFNLDIAKFVKSRTNIPVYYYISPKIWAWKEYRIKNIRRDVDELFSILPFEVDFFEKKHHYPIHYVGNPTADEVRQYLADHPAPAPAARPVIALLAGSRKQEIKDNLPAMIEAVRPYMQDYQVVLAGAPSIGLTGRLKRWLLKVEYVSLVNLIADREVVTELVADTFSVANIRMELGKILSGPAREAMLAGYQEVRRRLGDQCAPEEAARLIVSLNNNKPL